MNGDIATYTMTQEQYSASLDNFEEMIGGYYASAIAPEIPELEEPPTVSDLEITYSGSPAVKAGGGFKKFILKSRVDGKLVNCTEEVSWSVSFIIEDPESHERIDASENYLDYDKENKTNIFKVKCAADYSLIGKTFTITATTKHGSKSLIVEVTSL